MSRKKIFLMIQSLLCILAAVLLASGAIGLYLDGAARQAEGDLFYYMYTRERVADLLQKIMPLLFAGLGLSIGGIILGIRDERMDRPAEGKSMVSAPERLRSGADGRKTVVLRTALIVIALAMIAAGIVNGGMDDVLAKGSAICTECVGIG